jgi:hypothetical protein
MADPQKCSINRVSKPSMSAASWILFVAFAMRLPEEATGVRKNAGVPTGYVGAGRALKPCFGNGFAVEPDVFPYEIDCSHRL